MRAALYVRVSTEKQTERYSLPAQHRALQEFCERQGWPYEVYEDAGISGETIDARPAMLRLLEDARAQRFTVALAVEMERFSRSEDLFDWLVIKKTFREAGVRFGTPAQVFDPADDEDDFLTDLFGALSKREKKKILVRMQRGKIEAARRGRYIGSFAPYGYSLENGTLSVEETEAQKVRLIFSLLVRDGKSTREIVRTLTRRGITARKGGRWGRSSVRRVLTNPVYVGRAFYNRRQRVAIEGRRGKQVRPRPESDWVLIPVPRVVSDELFDQAQERLKKNSVLSPRNQKLRYLLKGLVRCAECGRAMYAVPIHGKPYYRCAGKSKLVASPPCLSRSVSADRLEKFVWNQLGTLLQKPGTILAEARRWKESRITERDEMQLRLEYVLKALQGLSDERQRVLVLHREGYASLDDVRGQFDQIDRKRTGLETERKILEVRLAGQTVNEEQTVLLEAVVHRVGHRLTRLTFPEQFQLVHAFIQRVLVARDGGIELHGYVPLIAPKESGPGSSRSSAHYLRTL